MFHNNGLSPNKVHSSSTDFLDNKKSQQIQNINEETTINGLIFFSMNEIFAYLGVNVNKAGELCDSRTILYPLDV